MDGMEYKMLSCLDRCLQGLVTVMTVERFLFVTSCTSSSKHRSLPGTKERDWEVFCIHSMKILSFPTIASTRWPHEVAGMRANGISRVLNEYSSPSIMISGNIPIYEGLFFLNIKNHKQR